MRVYEPCSLSSLPATPWKNGGGSTRTLAMEPAFATLHTFLWRISLAQIDAPGDFSAFPGIDRTILLWSGNGIVMRSSAWTQSLSQPCVPFAFRGEETITCELIDGPSLDLNIMVRRGEMDAEVLWSDRTIMLDGFSGTAIVICRSVGIRVLIGGRETLFRNGEFLRIDDCTSMLVISPSAAGSSFLVISLKSIRG